MDSEVPDVQAPRMGRSIVDRAAHRRTDSDWLAQAWQRAQVVRISATSTVPTRETGSGLQVALVPSNEVDASAPTWFLGCAADQPYFAVLAPEQPGWLGPRGLATRLDDLDLDLLITAVALVEWHQRHPRCPSCGSPTEPEQGGWTRRCSNDGSQHFPRTDPAVIMLVHDGAGRCLLGRNAQWSPGRFSTLAGFVEPGESLESAVAREVFEEVGVEVTDIRYVASQPWPFPSSLMLGFTALAKPEETVRPDNVEMAEAAWFTRVDVRRAADWTDQPATAGQPATAEKGVLRGIPPHLSISRFLIDRWLAGDSE